MPTYSIKDLEAITGIRAHTIRAWEQRYQLFQPKRTPTNIRRYSGYDLRRLSAIAYLIRHGMKISQLARMHETEIRDMFRRFLDARNENVSKDFELMKIIALEMDELKFEKYFSSLVLQRGFERAVAEVLFPFLEHMAASWHIEPHLMGIESCLYSFIRQKICLALEMQLPVPRKNNKTFILFLPEQHPYDIPLMLCQYELKNRGHQVVYLGSELPAAAVAHVAREKEADFLITSLMKYTGNLEHYMYALINQLNGRNQQTILLGNSLEEMQMRHLPVTYLASWESFKNFVELQTPKS